MGEFLFFSSYFTSKFYIFDSGLPQPSHFLILFLILFFLIKKLELKKDLSLQALSIFISYIIIVNLIWAIISDSQTYIVSMIFWIFNYLTFIVFTNIEKFRFNILQYLILVSFSIIVLCWVLGLGRYNFNPRYNFYFNDPNQLAFWVLCSLSVYLIKPNKLSLLAILLGLLIIISSMSRSALLGVILIFIGYLSNIRLNLKGILLKVISLFLLVLSLTFITFTNQEEIMFVIDRFSETDVEDQADVRGYTALIKYPEYLLFGAGQGEYDRFSSTNHEIHSNWAGLLFYYGFIGLTIFSIFLWSILSKLSLYEKIIFLAPLVYGFSTYGLRTSIFWFFLAVFYIYAKNKRMMSNEI